MTMTRERRRRLVVRVVLRTVAAAAAVTLTVLLAENRASSAFTAQTGSPGNAATAALDFCVPRTDTLLATADTTVYESNLGGNYGGYADLGVVSEAGRNARTLVRFGLPAGPAHCTLTGATLRLHVNSPSTVSGRPLQAYRVDPATPWTELGTTWTSRPAVVAGTAVEVPSRSTIGWQQWTVTGIVTDHYAGTNTGFLVRDRLEGAAAPGHWQLYDSRSKPNVPQLVLTWG